MHNGVTEGRAAIGVFLHSHTTQIWPTKCFKYIQIYADRMWWINFQQISKTSRYIISDDKRVYIFLFLRLDCMVLNGIFTHFNLKYENLSTWWSDEVLARETNCFGAISTVTSIWCFEFLTKSASFRSCEQKFAFSDRESYIRLG